MSKWTKRTTIKMTLKSGHEVVVRRPSTRIALENRRLPGLFLKLADGGDQTADQQAEALANLSGSEYQAMIDFMLASVMDACVNPQIVENPDPFDENQVAPEDVPAADIYEIWGWIGQGCPGLPVGEGVTAESVLTFPERPAAVEAAEPRGTPLRFTA